ncbi:LLM class F420-dependent oxidoreductase [Frankia sp. CNm7]|uniref:LLM class F420-dependent oxidoreductase n=1 Tax=Frankia nepalensis TaxID=1836974 RepID=A0A937UQY9_9ACTN|nr:LLM class F420-dependent oxidoreductase [Frankia nepalensis]MBL7498971.1 LLM class F420-dependent oxidoreductase [Frankia nepalensis]MBL7511509.1 LLM class F420-dependent oxidoreductase [Frankia nepalensis]MBL7520725.1 LLM class F420-dependent oxidoreductase [Frankia nepalensis]MBL7630752.1 LLM class F420-dependent oxidoreductase [Frankia nepalensis]
MKARPVRMGAVLPQAEIKPSDPQAVRLFAEQVERLGFDHLIAYDHVLGADSRSRPDWSGHYDHEIPFLEPLTLFAYLGATSSLELVTGVLILPQRQTALVAKQAATVDTLLGGRLRLGVGIGWNEVEYDGLGVPFRSRAARLEEQIHLLRRLWTEPAVDHKGQFDVVDRAGINPLPVQRPIPIWIGCGDAPTALERVGRLADGWIPHPTLGAGHRLAAAWTAVRAAAERAGRDPAALGLQGQVRLTTGGLAGVTAKVERWVALGATHVALNTLEAGLRWPADHLALYTQIADAWRTEDP